MTRIEELQQEIEGYVSEIMESEDIYILKGLQKKIDATHVKIGRQQVIEENAANAESVSDIADLVNEIGLQERANARRNLVIQTPRVY